MKKVAVYVDGYNVYFGLRTLWKEKHRPCFYWLDYWKLGERLVQSSPIAESGDTLTIVKYFTAILEDDRPKAQNHREYIAALEALAQVEVILGKFQPKRGSCNRCGYSWPSGEEKKSDVAIGVNLVKDAIDNIYDKAILVTADMDQVPAVEMVHSTTTKTIVLARPPERPPNADLRAACRGVEMAFGGHLATCLLPDPIIDLHGNVFRKPPHWS